MDYFFAGFLALYDFFDNFKGDSYIDKEIQANDIKYADFVSFGVNLIAFALFLPILIDQMSSFYNLKKKIDTQSVSNESISELSDTRSMLVRPSDEWNHTNYLNETSFLAVRRKNGSDNILCCSSKKAMYM